LDNSELTYEPFLGSGTGLAAAELTERVCCGMELDPKYADVAIQRWQSLSNQKATLDGDGLTFEEIAQQRRQKGRMNRSLPRGGRRGSPDPGRASGSDGLVGGVAAAAMRTRNGHCCATSGPRSLARKGRNLLRGVGVISHARQ
jgi:hypothetical protein